MSYVLVVTVRSNISYIQHFHKVKANHFPFIGLHLMGKKEENIALETGLSHWSD